MPTKRKKPIPTVSSQFVDIQQEFEKFKLKKQKKV